MPSFRPDDRQLEQFQREGMLLVRGLLTDEETGALNHVLERDPILEHEGRAKLDARGAATHLAVRNALGDDLFSTVARSRRIVDTTEALLGGEVYHYHHKIMEKRPGGGGAWEWHQDYGYWYANGCLRPDMASCMVALSPHTLENGCLQVIPGSHLCGRLDHGTVGDQTGADPRRVEWILGRHPPQSCLLKAGDGLFFHCNLLHRSQQNRSAAARKSLICCYNAASNDPVLEHHHLGYSPLEKLEDEDLLRRARRELAKTAEDRS